MIKIKARPKFAVATIIFFTIIVFLVLSKASRFKEDSARNQNNLNSHESPQAESTSTTNQSKLETIQNPNIPNELKNSFLTIELNPRNDKSASATVSIIKDEEKNVFVVIVEANLKNPSQDLGYQAWLVKKNSGKPLLIGQLEKTGDKFATSSTVNGIPADYNLIFISLEKEIDDKPEERILESTL